MITDADAYRIYARAWNCLEPNGLVELLAEDVVLSSQKWDGDIRGKEKAEEYIRVKMDTLRVEPGYRVYAQLAETQPYPMAPNPPKPCVVLSQGDPQTLMLTVFIEVSESKITAITMCIIPPPHTTKLSGEFPGLEKKP